MADRSAEIGRLVAELAGLDELLRARGMAWSEHVQHLDALRRQIVVTSAQVQRRHALSARNASRDDGAGGDAGAPAPTRDEGLAPRMTREFEVALREAEERRVALHAEMDDLRRRRSAVLRCLPTAITRAYGSAASAGREPVIATTTEGTCGCCATLLSESDRDALKQGEVVVCAGCDRLLRPSEGGT